MPPQQQAPESALTDHAALAALTVILLSDQDQESATEPVTALLGALGIGAAAAGTALALLAPHRAAVEVVPPNSASGHINRTEIARSAAYLLQAGRRLDDGGDLTTERRYLAQHLNAQRIRQRAARYIDAAARLFGPKLGWRAVLDTRTTPECRAAHGANFHFATPPLIGYPGILHGGTCRCLPGRPFDNARSVDEATANVLGVGHT